MKLGHLLSLSGVLGAAAAALGGVPTNDTCSNPMPIGAGLQMFDTTDGTFSGTHASCDYSDETAADLWYLYTAQVDGVAEIGNYLNTDCTTSMYLQVSLMSGTGCGGTELACQDDICNYQSMRLRVAQGTSYLLRFTTYVKGPGSFTIVEHQAPDNDRCENASLVGPGAYEWNDYWAWGDAPYSTCQEADDAAWRDLWYAYTAASTGNVAIDVGTNNGTNISVFDGTCAGPELSCGGFSSGGGQQGQHWAGFPITTGHKYLIKLSRGANTSEQVSPLNIREFPTPANDTCTQIQAMSAMPLTFAGTTYNYDNAGAVDVGPNEISGGCGQVNGSIWYKFTAPQAGVAIFQATSEFNGSQYTTISTYSSCNAANITGCGTGYINVAVVAGETIYVRVGQIVISGYNNFYRAGTLTASLVPPVPNDACASPTPLSVGSIVLNNLNAVSDTLASPPACIEDPSANAHDLWYSWTSPNAGTLLLNTCNVLTFGLYDSSLAVYTDCGGAPIACDDNSDEFGASNFFADGGNSCSDKQSNIEIQTTPNAVYKIRVSGYPWGEGRLHVAFAPNNSNPLSSATNVQASSSSQSATIDAVLSGSSDVDIYKIHICNVDAFSATTDTPNTSFNTQLFLFDAQGNGISHNDNIDPGAGNYKSTLTDQYIFEEGDYYLAVSGSYFGTYSRRPISSGGLIWSGNYPAFELDPDGPGASGPVTGWIGFNSISLSSPAPAYRLIITGICTSCTADFNGVNGVTVQDIFDFLTAWLAGSPSANFNGVNGVTVQDIFDFLTAWLAGC